MKFGGMLGLCELYNWSDQISITDPPNSSLWALLPDTHGGGVMHSPSTTPLVISEIIPMKEERCTRTFLNADCQFIIDFLSTIKHGTCHWIMIYENNPVNYFKSFF